ncbi:hypothetical protein ABPG72_011307 [Tetrahymena utriculariae]
MTNQASSNQLAPALGYQKIPVQQQHIKKSIVDFLAGMITGWVSVITLQPLDMIKTTMQTSSNKQSILGCAKEIYQRSKMKGFYRGMLFPLIGSSFFSAIYYGSNEQMKKLICFFSNHKYDRTSLPLQYIFFSGSFAGLTTSCISIPVEHVKIRLQTQKNQQFTGSIDCFKKILRNHGVVGLYNSSILQLSRDFIGCGSFFVMYDITKRHFKRQNNGELDKLRLFLSGCVAGMSYWPLCFPLDVIKTKMQSDSFVKPEFQNIKDCALQIYRYENRGFLNFYRGFLISNLRSIPNSAIALFTFENVLGFLSKLFGIQKPKH